ncbi:MAG: helix-turn-helix domain-containing protein [Devosia sp.]|nr:helix-turn-helix domain-containing protein [Devosia sp.]
MRPSTVTLHAENAVIYAQGAPAGPLYFVEFGAVRICRLTSDGRRQISAFHFAGEVFGFEADGEHHFYAESIDGAGIRVLRPTCADHMAANILPLALRSLTRAQEHLLVLGRQNAIERVAAFLLDLADRQDTGQFIELPMQRSDIADYLGLTFETVSRILRKLKDARIIRLPSTKQIEVLDFGALEDFCE